jgi:hypothetical protein
MLCKCHINHINFSPPALASTARPTCQLILYIRGRPLLATGYRLSSALSHVRFAAGLKRTHTDVPPLNNLLRRLTGWGLEWPRASQKEPSDCVVATPLLPQPPTRFRVFDCAVLDAATESARPARMRRLRRQMWRRLVVETVIRRQFAIAVA